MSWYAMSAGNVVRLVDRLIAHEADICVAGGWAVDALLGHQTREHSDLDLWAPAAHLEALAGQGSVAGVAVRCEAAQWAVRWHTGYPARAVDRHDVPLLCRRFGIALPEGFDAAPRSA